MIIKKNALKAEKTKVLKPVTIEPFKQLSLPNMLPGQPTLLDTPIPNEPVLDRPDEPASLDQAIDKLPNLAPQSDPAGVSAQVTKKASPKKRAAQPKPTFNFDQLNHYAIAEGNSIFKNKGENRPPTKEDLAILMYQERVKKHFSVSLNRYATQANFYNVNRAAIDLVIIIGKDGRVLDLRTRNHSNNPALHNLMEKIIKYAGLFPVIPENTKLTNFTLMTTVTISQGKLISGYGWQ